MIAQRQVVHWYPGVEEVRALLHCPVGGCCLASPSLLPLEMLSSSNFACATIDSAYCW